ncbi:tetratricopeptide repeat protein [Flagellimonas flava]|uniref:tetratricopeptide repeat protein n=1 Tax=Flagellimonas flava TaxID=570519 RepID=UPI003D65AA17
MTALSNKIPLTDWLWGFALWILLLVLAIIWYFPNRGTPFEIGCKYYFGKNVPVNYGKAKNYFKKSADTGFAPAQYNLGIMYLNNQGVEKNVQTAISYFMLASDQNYTNAQVQLGNLYFNGKELPKNLDRALSFYKSACKNGSQDACNMVKHIEEKIK